MDLGTHSNNFWILRQIKSFRSYYVIVKRVFDRDFLKKKFTGNLTLIGTRKMFREIKKSLLNCASSSPQKFYCLILKLDSLINCENGLYFFS